MPEAVAETARVALRCQFDLTRDLGYRYPSTDDADRELVAHLPRTPCTSAIARGSQHAAASSRLDEELALIAHHRLAGFFLLHREILELAREIAVEVRGPSAARQVLPPGRGRGSSVGSIVCYLTGLSHVDPVAARLSLGRFLNREMVSAPDIDLDFPRDVRAKLIPAVHERYGRDRSALIAAFATYRSRGAIRELGKVLGLPAADLDRLARASDGHNAERRRRRDGEPARRGRAGPRSTLPRARVPGRRDRRAAAPPLAALGRDGRLHRAGSTSSCRSCPRPWRVARSASGTRTRAPTPAS